MKEFKLARKRIEVSVGESVRIIRELQEMSQSQLAAATGIPQSTISAIENGRINLGVERAKQLAKVLRCHPAVLVFPGWEITESTATSRSSGRREAAVCYQTASRAAAQRGRSTTRMHGSRLAEEVT